MTLARGAKRTAVIVNALDNMAEGRASWLKAQTEKLVALGFDVTELDLRHYFGKSDELGKRLIDIDMV